MPKPNYKFAKRQKEIAKQKKKEEKLKRKLEKKPDDVQEVENVGTGEEKSEQAVPVAKAETDKE